MQFHYTVGLLNYAHNGQFNLYTVTEINIVFCTVYSTVGHVEKMEAYIHFYYEKVLWLQNLHKPIIKHLQNKLMGPHNEKGPKSFIHLYPL